MARVSFVLIALLFPGLPGPLEAQTVASADRILPRAQGVEGSRDRLLLLPARLTVVGVPLRDAIEALRDRSGVPVAFSPSRVGGEGTVTCLCQESTVGEALERILRGSGFRPVEVGGRILIESGAEPPGLGARVESPEARVRSDPPRLLAVGAGSRLADMPPGLRTGVITGIVVDVATGRPLAGAQIQIMGRDLGALADAEGRYRIAGIPAGEVTVRVLLIGYGTATRTVDLRSGETLTLDFPLRQEALGLDAIVVTGTPGEQQARSLGNVLGRIRASELQEVAPSPNLETLLGGAEPGVNVQIGSGAVGSGANIRIRGASSIALSSQPLIYVDGVRVFGGPDLGGGVSGLATRASHPTSRLNDINPEDIETIEVIKGPAAATLYGTEASNGVINIITKRGSRGAPRVNLALKQGANWYPNPETFFPSTYFRCQGTSGTCTPGEVVEFNVLREDRVRHGHEHFRTGSPGAPRRAWTGDRRRSATTSPWTSTGTRAWSRTTGRTS